jgi:hypothetical protein
MQHGIPSEAEPMEVFNEPESMVDTRDIEETARVGKSRKWKEIRSHMESRIATYQHYLPGAIPVPQANLTPEQVAQKWEVATTIIQEFQALIDLIDMSVKQIEAMKRAKDEAGGE